jgi:membrane carboxypeptidase/penicillin-binding protein
MGASTMDGQLGRRFFLDPELTFQRRYEALRAVVAEGRPVTEVAARFGY